MFGWKHHGQARPAFAEEPGPGQESVWDYPRPPALRSDARRVRVLSGERLIANSTSALRVLETASPPTFYLPPDDVDTRYLKLDPAGSSFCEWKGEATYFDIETEAGRIVDAAWSYRKPKKRFTELAGYFSFYPGKVDCFVDDERVLPQPGRFYGGWMTSEIVGPVKGEPGTSGW
jgi:uncharacterized protein (DUF427 family)